MSQSEQTVEEQEKKLHQCILTADGSQNVLRFGRKCYHMVRLLSYCTYTWYIHVVLLPCCIDREEESRKQLREMQKQITEVKRSHKTELQQREEMIAHLTDQLQEVKAKTAMEGKYVKKMCDVSIAQTQKRCLMSEKALQNEIAVCIHVYVRSIVHQTLCDESEALFRTG